jgi:hypothetical protein
VRHSRGMEDGAARQRGRRGEGRVAQLKATGLVGQCGEEGRWAAAGSKTGDGP